MEKSGNGYKKVGVTFKIFKSLRNPISVNLFLVAETFIFSPSINIVYFLSNQTLHKQGCYQLPLQHLIDNCLLKMVLLETWCKKLKMFTINLLFYIKVWDNGKQFFFMFIKACVSRNYAWSQKPLKYSLSLQTLD